RFLNLHCPHVGRFAHPYNCHEYVDCLLQNDGHLVQRQGSCKDQIFHPELKNCVDQKAISCGVDLESGDMIFSNIKQAKSSQDKFKYSGLYSDVKFSDTDMKYINNLLQSISSGFKTLSNTYTDSLRNESSDNGESEINSKMKITTVSTIDEEIIQSDLYDTIPIYDYDTVNDQNIIDDSAINSPVVPQNDNLFQEFLVHSPESETNLANVKHRRIHKHSQPTDWINKDESSSDKATYPVFRNSVRDVAQFYLGQKGSKLFRSPEHDHICISGASFGCANCQEAVVCGGGRAYLAPCRNHTTCRDATPFEGGVCHPVHSDECTCKKEDIIKPDPYDPFAFLQCSNKDLPPNMILCPENSVFDMATVSCVTMPEFPSCTGAGTFSHPRDCQWYYTCLSGPTQNTWLRIPHRCGPHNQVYSKVLARCAPASLPAADSCSEQKVEEV
ncbi:unnamed protein product, partial [Meganyctiphanes norvegica]